MTLPIIALLSDFGITDPYVGIMKGVISTIAPGAPLIDLTHLISPGDIQQGAYYLWQSSRDFPPGTVFLAVVDPGVGTNRRGVYLQRGEQIFIGPDNGLFSYLEYKNQVRAWELTNLEYQLHNPSSTFHGRDIFAPAAAHAVNGAQGAEFGKALDDLVKLPQPTLHRTGKSLRGEIISTDRFGNLITSLGSFQRVGSELHFQSWQSEETFSVPGGSAFSIEIENHHMPLAATFADTADNQCAGIIGSTGLLEVVANQKSAADILNLSRGSQVTLSWT